MGRQRKINWKEIVIAIVTGVVSSLIVTTAAYFVLRQNLSQTIAEGVKILDVEGTSKKIIEIEAACEEARRALTTPIAHPTDKTVLRLNVAINRLSEKIDSLVTMERYTGEEIANMLKAAKFSDERQAIIEGYKNRPLKITNNLPSAKVVFVELQEVAKTLEDQLAAEKIFDHGKALQSISDIEKLANSAKASMNSRQIAILQTLEKFGKD